MARLKERQGDDPPLELQALGTQLQWYREQLQACSDPMLRYEWAWLHDHLSSLNLSSGHAGMRAALGGRDHVEHLVRETAAFRVELEQELQRRGLEASGGTLPLEPMEHAWELSSPAIRRAWGIGENDDETVPRGSTGAWIGSSSMERSNEANPITTGCRAPAASDDGG